MGAPTMDNSLDIPHYMLPRPTLTYTDDDRAVFDSLLQAAANGDGRIAYHHPLPRWQFLCYLAEEKGFLLHGSGDPDVRCFEPQPNSDINPFGAQTAVYAASDGIWPLYYAILDRDRYPMTLHNACTRFCASGQWSEPLYFISITETALVQQPWRDGTVYLLRRDTFTPHPDTEYRGFPLQIPMWASQEPVIPVAKLAVTPEDFPFLAHIRGHDDAVVSEQTFANPNGFPDLHQ
ncbi:MAG: hypothetical protein OHK0029_10660 [Armatimonadaceae bacterium]